MKNVLKYLVNFSIAASLTMSLTGCIILGDDRSGDDWDWKSQQEENRHLISNLSLGTKRQAVLNQLGVPSFSEAFSKGSDEYRVLYYRTQHRRSDGDTTKDETTPLVFKNDKLVGWGEGAIDMAQ